MRFGMTIVGRLTLTLVAIVLTAIALSETVSAHHPGELPDEIAVVPACTPWPGSAIDPCERRVPWEWPGLKYPSVVSLIAVPNPPLTIRGAIDKAFERRSRVPHIIVRGIVVPGSTRCASQTGTGLFLSDPSKPHRWRGDSHAIRCYSEIEIREYLVGSGSARVTLLTGLRNYDDQHRSYGIVPRDADYFADISGPLVEALEGREWIFWLELPSDPSNEVWDSTKHWSVQKLANGTVVAVDRFSGWHSESDQSKYQSRLEIPLADYAAQVKSAHAHYVTLYGGKVDASDGAPDLIASADDASLKAYLRAEGVYDIPGFTASPPPPPPNAPPELLYASLQYGTAVVPPCEPWPGSAIDPCERRSSSSWWPVTVPSGPLALLPPPPDPPLTIRDVMDEAFESRWSVPHIVARGIIAPGSTRCLSQTGTGLYSGDPSEPSVWRGGGLAIRCYSEIAIREYLVGSGPTIVTLLRGGYSWVDRQDEAFLRYNAEPLVQAFEGREWIFWLQVPLDPATETWESDQYWGVQKLENGTVVAVDPWSGWYSEQSTYPSSLDIPLADYATQVKAARAHYDTLYGGKVDGEDGAPDLITRADTASLKAYLRAEGVYDVPGFTPSPPPPLTPAASDLLYDSHQYGDVVLHWAPPEGIEVTGYKVFRTNDAGATTEFHLVKPDVVTITDRYVPQVSGASYTYTIVAVSQNGESEPSNAMSVTLP